VRGDRAHLGRGAHRDHRGQRLAAGHARRWAKARNLSQVSVIELPRTKDPVGSVREATGGGADVVLELSGAEPSINLGLAAARPGAVISLLGIRARRPSPSATTRTTSSSRG
jgi:threonine dehydrogenase-like Zn-dependent dehydrogenase